MMNNNFYYAVFTETEEAVELFFPDIKGCVTFGNTWEEAYEMAKDALAGCLADETENITQTNFKDLQEKYGTQGKIMPVPLDEKIMRLYETNKRINISIPQSALTKIDEYRAKYNMKRSVLLTEATLEYIAAHN